MTRCVCVVNGHVTFAGLFQLDTDSCSRYADLSEQGIVSLVAAGSGTRSEAVVQPEPHDNLPTKVPRCIGLRPLH